MFKVKKPAPDARILKIREYEDKLRALQDKCGEQVAMEKVASWEAKTDRRIAANNVQREFSKLRAERQAALAARREQLAQKLQAEEAQLQRELLEGRETMGEKRARLAATARARWEAREAERQAHAAQLLERHFRENSDVLRTEFSKKRAEQTLAERERQVEDNTVRRLQQLAERTAWAECEQFEGLKATMRGLAEQQKRIDDKHMTERLLDAQLREKAARLEEEHAREERELRGVMQFQAERDAEARAQEARAREEARQVAEQMRQYNESKIAEDTMAAARETEEDREWMRNFLAREAQQVQAERALRDRQREEMRRWKEALENASRAEAVDEQEMEAIMAKYQAEQAAKYDAQQRALDEARDRLNREVAEVRARQVADKQRARAAALEEGFEERRRMLEEDLAMADLEAEFKGKLKREALEQRLDLQTQVAFNEEKRRVEEAEKRRELDRLRDNEANYQQRVNEAAEHKPPAFYGRPKVDWFYHGF